MRWSRRREIAHPKAGEATEIVLGKSVDHDASDSVTLRLTGTRRSLDHVLTLLGFLAECSQAGTTQWVQLLVDGDGGFSLALDVDGRAVRLGPELSAYLLGEATDARPSSLGELDFRRAPGHDLRDETVLLGELV